MASGSKSREPLNAVVRSVAKQKRLQRDGAAQHEPGSSLVHDGVGIEQEDVVAAGLGRPPVAARSEAEVLG
jgi:hypothetical protein